MKNKTFAEIELKIYNLKRLGFKLFDPIMCKAIKERTLIEKNKFNSLKLKQSFN